MYISRRNEFVRFLSAVRRGVCIGACALLCALPACTMGPNFHEPPAPRVGRIERGTPVADVIDAGGASQHFSADATLPRDWWTKFGSSAIDRVVTDALVANPTLASAQAALRQSEDDMRAGTGVFYPQIDASMSASRQKYSPLRVGSNEPPMLFNLFTLSAQVSYALDIWGGERRSLEALRAQSDVQRHALAAAYLTLSANIVNTMIAFAAYGDEVAATREMIALLDEQVSVTHSQVAAGVAAYSAVLTLENERATLEATIPALMQRREQAGNLLAVLSGSLPSQWDAPDMSLENIALPALLPRAVSSEVVRQRPDIRQAEAALHVASAKIGVATANLFPSVTLTAGGGYGNRTMGALLSQNGQVWSAGADVTAPLFHGGTLWFERRAAIDAYEQARAAYEQVVLAAFEQVADTLRALENDAHALDADARALATSEEALRLLQADYEAGTVGYLSILVADGQRHQARIAWLQGVALRLQDTVALFAALGGGWYGEEAH
ncbi:RND transporter [Caballeronia jiangsuensis]|nr:RND transporter [Caballeronia jiangsuensis]